MCSNHHNQQLLCVNSLPNAVNAAINRVSIWSLEFGVRNTSSWSWSSQCLLMITLFFKIRRLTQLRQRSSTLTVRFKHISCDSCCFQCTLMLKLFYYHYYDSLLHQGNKLLHFISFYLKTELDLLEPDWYFAGLLDLFCTLANGWAAGWHRPPLLEFGLHSSSSELEETNKKESTENSRNFHSVIKSDICE